MQSSFSLKTKRFDDLRKRKNFLPSVVITFILWIALFAIVYFLSPESTFSLLLFFVIFFIATLFTFSLLLVNKRRGLLIAVSSSLFLFLRYFGIGNIINLILLIGISIAFEFYFSKRA